MNSLILITTYLAKDVFKRWIETPGALAARFLVATSLCLVFLFVKAGFLMAEMAIEEKIESLGVNTVVVRAFSKGPEEPRPLLSELLHPLQEEGVFLPVSFSFVRAKLPNGQNAQIAFYESDAISAFNSIITDFETLTNPQFLIAGNYPESAVLRVSIQDHYFDAQVVEMPSAVRFLTRNKPLLFLPASSSGPLSEQSMTQTVLFLADDPASVASKIGVIEALLKEEGFEQYEAISALHWLDELSQIRTMRIKGQAVAGIFMMTLIVLIFGSISIFEYRQNVYTTALMKSFGISVGFLIVRYFLEAVVILFLSLWAATEVAEYSHQSIFRMIGFANESMVFEGMSPYSLSQNTVLVVSLLVSSFAGVVPVCFALRRPVGRVLA